MTTKLPSERISELVAACRNSSPGESEAVQIGGAIVAYLDEQHAAGQGEPIGGFPVRFAENVGRLLRCEHGVAVNEACPVCGENSVQRTSAYAVSSVEGAAEAKPEYPDAEQAWADLPQDIVQQRSFVAGYNHAGVEMEIARNDDGGGHLLCPKCGGCNTCSGSCGRPVCSGLCAPVAEPPSPVAGEQHEPDCQDHGNCDCGSEYKVLLARYEQLAAAKHELTTQIFRSGQALVDALLKAEGLGLEIEASHEVLTEVERVRDEWIARAEAAQSKLASVEAERDDIREAGRESREHWDDLRAVLKDTKEQLRRRQCEIAHALGLEHATDTVCEPADWPTLEDGARSLVKTYHSLVDEFMARGSALAEANARAERLAELVQSSAPLTWAASCDTAAAHEWEKRAEWVLSGASAATVVAPSQPLQDAQPVEGVAVGGERAIVVGSAWHRDAMPVFVTRVSDGVVWSADMNWSEANFRARYAWHSDPPATKGEA